MSVSISHSRRDYDGLDDILPPLQSVADSHVDLPPGPLPRLAGDLSHCGAWALVGTCTGPDQHRVAKQLCCGKEWCPKCGQLNSPHHFRRMARQFGKLISMESCGYMVFTIPKHLRSFFITPSQLSAHDAYVRRLLRRKLGKTRGFTRWHFAGDKDTSVWNPHLNVVIEWGWISPELLQSIKSLYKAWLEKRVDEKIEKISVYYQYIWDFSPKALNKRVHVLRYVTRPTFGQDLVDRYLHEFSMDATKVFHGFRNIKELGQSPRGYYSRMENLPTIVQRFILKSKTFKTMLRIGDDRSEWKCPTCGKKVIAEMILPSRRDWIYPEHGSLVLTPQQYRDACTKEVKQILLM